VQTGSISKDAGERHSGVGCHWSYPTNCLSVNDGLAFSKASCPKARVLRKLKVWNPIILVPFLRWVVLRSFFSNSLHRLRVVPGKKVLGPRLYLIGIALKDNKVIVKINTCHASRDADGEDFVRIAGAIKRHKKHGIFSDKGDRLN
jgi:hypothetical protein